MFCDPVGRENDDGSFGDFVDFVHEQHALLLEGIDDELVMDDFMAYVDRRAELFEGLFDDVDGAVNTGTESAGGCKYQFLHLFKILEITGAGS